MRMLRYNGGLGPSVRAAGVDDWRTGETHPIAHDGVAKSLMKSGRFTDVTEGDDAKPKHGRAKTKQKPPAAPAADDVPTI